MLPTPASEAGMGTGKVPVEPREKVLQWASGAALHGTPRARGGLGLGDTPTSRCHPAFAWCDAELRVGRRSATGSPSGDVSEQGHEKRWRDSHRACI